MKELYQPSATEVVTIIVPEMQFLMIDGMGSPGEAQDYLDALAVLYPIAFKTKFLSKAKGKDYVVPPLEGLWWADDMNDFTSGNRDKWKWTMMIMQPLKNSRPGCVPPPTLLSRSGDQTLKTPPRAFFA